MLEMERLNCTEEMFINSDTIRIWKKLKRLNKTIKTSFRIIDNILYAVLIKTLYVYC
jgi:hypothetical protein